MQNIELFGLFTIAFWASLGHCIGMCGGLVFAFNCAKISPNSSLFFRILMHFFYHFARVCMYMLLGALIGGFGVIFTQDLILKNSTLLVVNTALIFIGLCLLFRPKILTSFEFGLDYVIFKKIYPLFQNLFKPSKSTPKGIAWAFLLGALNGILPCGIVYYFLLSALVAGSAINGAIVMGIFGSATFLVMFLFGILTSSFGALFGRFQGFFMLVCAFCMIGFGAHGFFLALKYFL